MYIIILLLMNISFLLFKAMFLILCQMNDMIVTIKYIKKNKTAVLDFVFPAKHINQGDITKTCPCNIQRILSAVKI